ncbi:MAG: DUF58 domain-containing protein [Phycisphaerae bacterium]|nr:DUF58 domain-containing protein [Phycisphaerae bacterium]
MIRSADHSAYLDPTALARVKGLDLRARLVVQGFMSGMHHSPMRGIAVEFAEYRKYCQGDDLRTLDWKVYGRTDKHYIKQFEQETNLRVLIVVDCSESMGYRHEQSPMSKREYATTAAAAIAYLALQQSDSVALATFDTRLRKLTRSSNHPGKWRLVVRELELADGSGRTSIRGVLDEIAERLHLHHLIILLSDLLGDPQDVLRGLKHLRHRGHEPIVLHVMDDAELTFPFEQAMRFDGLEGAGPILAEPRLMRERYIDEVRKFIRTVRQGCHAQEADYELLNTRERMSVVLSSYLAMRKKRGLRRR